MKELVESGKYVPSYMWNVEPERLAVQQNGAAHHIADAKMHPLR